MQDANRVIADRSPAGIVAAMHAAWQDAFAQRDPGLLASLYTADALFYGSAETLYRGRDGVRAYFTQLPPRFKRARFAEAAVVVLARDVIAASGPVAFAVEQDGVATTLPYRMTHVLCWQDCAWLIATHHASPVPGR